MHVHVPSSPPEGLCAPLNPKSLLPKSMILAWLPGRVSGKWFLSQGIPSPPKNQGETEDAACPSCSNCLASSAIPWALPSPIPKGLPPVPVGLAPVSRALAPISRALAPIPRALAPVPNGLAPVPSGIVPIPKDLAAIPTLSSPGVPLTATPAPVLVPSPEQPQLPAVPLASLGRAGAAENLIHFPHVPPPAPNPGISSSLRRFGMRN